MSFIISGISVSGEMMETPVSDLGLLNLGCTKVLMHEPWSVHKDTHTHFGEQDCACRDRTSGCDHILFQLHDYSAITNILSKNCPKHSLHTGRTSSAWQHCPRGKEMGMCTSRWLAGVPGPVQFQAQWGRTRQHTWSLLPIPALALFATLAGLPVWW